MDKFINGLVKCRELHLIQEDNGLHARIPENFRTQIVDLANENNLLTYSIDRGTAVFTDGVRSIMVDCSSRIHDTSRALALSWAIAWYMGIDVEKNCKNMERTVAILVHRGEFAAEIQNDDPVSYQLAPLLVEHVAHLLEPVAELNSEKIADIVINYKHLLAQAVKNSGVG